ncbi:MAG TPA: hypothetical protein PKM43_22380, partial [Verrucomicrobiota bacterium]|nr:hypothetical protein [Verrucomicrobiota bacterium]
RHDSEVSAIVRRATFAELPDIPSESRTPDIGIEVCLFSGAFRFFCGREGANPKLSAFCGNDVLSAAASTPRDTGSKQLTAPSSEPTASTTDTDPRDRRGDRLLTCLGLLEDAPPFFGSGRSVPRAGVLLAMPALVCAGVFACAQQIFYETLL